MKTFHRPAKSRTSAVRRARLLAAFDRSGLSATDFARQRGLTYTTFCGWRHRRAKTEADEKIPTKGIIAVQIHGGPPTEVWYKDIVIQELPAAAAPVELMIELNPQARLRLTHASQIELAERLLQALNTATPC